MVSSDNTLKKKNHDQFNTKISKKVKIELSDSSISEQEEKQKNKK